MNKFRYISPLTETQRYELEELRKGQSEAKVNSRSHAILLSSEGFTIEELVEIFFRRKRYHLKMAKQLGTM